VRTELAIAGFVVLEARRTRFAWLLIAGLALAVGAGLFAGETAITESAQVRAAVAAAGVRLAAVFLLALFVTASMVRAIDDKQLDILLALPLSRARILLGRGLGYGGIAAAVAATAGAALAALAPPLALLAWAASLLCELLVVAAFALLCVLSFAQVTAALAVVFAFYALARSMDALLLMADSPAAGGVAGELIATVLHAIAWVVPPLGRFTESGWLLYGPPPPEALALLAAQALAFAAFVAAAAMFDFARRSF